MAVDDCLKLLATVVVTAMVSVGDISGPSGSCVVVLPGRSALRHMCTGVVQICPPSSPIPMIAAKHVSRRRE